MKEGCERCLSKFLLPLAFIVCALGLAGCATTGNSYAQTHKQTAQVDYEFMDRHDDLRLVRRNNDLYIEKLDGSESRRVTNTPSVKEEIAKFTADGKEIGYTTPELSTSNFPDAKNYIRWGWRYAYMQPVNGDDNQREIRDIKDFWSLVEEE